MSTAPTYNQGPRDGGGALRDIVKKYAIMGKANNSLIVAINPIA